MPVLAKSAPHECLSCGIIFAARQSLKRHQTYSLKTTPTKSQRKGSKQAQTSPRCPGLKRPIESDFWDECIRPFYSEGADLPDISSYKKKKNNQIAKSFPCNNQNPLTGEHCSFKGNDKRFLGRGNPMGNLRIRLPARI